MPTAKINSFYQNNRGVRTGTSTVGFFHNEKTNEVLITVGNSIAHVRMDDFLEALKKLKIGI